MNASRRIQRLEAAAIAVLAVLANAVVHPAWWWVPRAAFLAFDLSMLDYLRSARVGAVVYNLVHNLAWPVVVADLAIAVRDSAPALATSWGVLSCAWAFHVGVDRALGYELKLPDDFRHTHLGLIGRSGAAQMADQHHHHDQGVVASVRRSSRGRRSR